VSALHERTAAELAALVRSGEVSAREVVLAHLARVEAVNERVNAVTITLREAALAAADAADRVRERGPLHGVPFTVKESLDLVGSPTTMGVPALRNRMPYADAPAVARLRAAGAIPIGRTNLSELGLRVDTDNPLRGRTLNPYDARLTAGGSSGGDAAAVATGMTPLGLGNDMGGSLRFPAGACGVAALKPTTGRIAHASSIEPEDLGLAMQMMLADGPIARSVADLRLALGVMAGRDPRDPRSVDAPLAGAFPDEPRAALIVDLPGGEVPPDVVAAIRRAGELLREAGWEVEEDDPPELNRLVDVWGQLLGPDLAVMTALAGPILSKRLRGHVGRLLQRIDAHPMSAARLHTERSRLARAWSSWLTRYTVAIGPCWAAPLWPRDADVDERTGLATLERTSRFVLPGSVLGLPALALPMGLAGGLPVGIQIYADLWREDLCLAAGEIVEKGVGAPRPIDPR
jgi:amidase